MPVITVQKPFDEIYASLLRHGELSTVIIGCEEFAKGCQTGGAKEVKKLRDKIQKGKLMLFKPEGMLDALKEGLCDQIAVNNLLSILTKQHKEFQLLLLCCGAGLKNVMNLLPNIRIVPGLNTIGVGSDGQLSCLCCGDCRFDESGCYMRKVKSSQIDRINDCYKK